MIIILLSFSVGIFGYIISSFAVFRLLRLVRYDKSFLAWIPVVKDFALIDAFKGVISGFPIIGLQCSVKNFKIAWIISVLIPSIGIGSESVVLSAILCILHIVIMGSVFTYIYASMENTSLSSRTFLGLLSGIFGIIAVIKFYMYNNSNLYNNRYIQQVINVNTFKSNFPNY